MGNNTWELNSRATCDFSLSLPFLISTVPGFVASIDGGLKLSMKNESPSYQHYYPMTRTTDTLTAKRVKVSVR